MNLNTLCIHVVILWLGIVGLSGCKSAPQTVVETPAKPDTRMVRLADDGTDAYATGHTELALERYRASIHRAWIRDDPDAVSAIAYNLAACQYSRGEHEAARMWLCECRASRRRLGHSLGDTWLLEARMALDDGQPDRAFELTCCARKACPPCEDFCPESCEEDPCDPRRRGCDRCKAQQRAQAAQHELCVDAYRASVELMAARVAIHDGDIVAAWGHHDRAKCCFDLQCLPSVRSELESVAGQIHFAAGEFDQAAFHFDCEVNLLRETGVYREIPTALVRAANAFEFAGCGPAAIDRLGRAARALHSRGENDEAWKHVKRAAAMAENFGLMPVGDSSLSAAVYDVGDEQGTTLARLRLIAEEIERAVDAEDRENKTANSNAREQNTDNGFERRKFDAMADSINEPEAVGQSEIPTGAVDGQFSLGALVRRSWPGQLD